MSAGSRRRPGETVALRELVGGRVWACRPATVVADDADGLRFYVGAGTRSMVATSGDGREAHVPDGAWTMRLVDQRPRHILSFAWEDRPHAILAIWHGDWRPRCWYVNLQVPLRRTATGFDTRDLFLDLVGDPDASRWRWKDEDELALAMDRGLVDAATADRIRDEASAIARDITAGHPPFDTDAWSWRPPESWPTPTLPADWDRV